MKKTIFSLLVISVFAISIYSEMTNPFFKTDPFRGNPVLEDSETRDRLSGAGKQMNMWWWDRAYPDPAFMTQKYLKAWEYAMKMKDPKLFPTYGNGQGFGT